MKHFKLASFLIAVFICLNTLTAQTDIEEQEEQIIEKAKTNKAVGSWAIGLGFNVVEDSGGFNLGDIFDSEISHFSNPFVVSAEYFANSKFSFNASISFNKYLVGKYVDSWEIQEGNEPNYTAIDLASRYSFRDVLNTTAFDPYIHVGFGYTKIGKYTTVKEDVPEVGRLTINTGAGTNFWFSDSWGVNLNYMLKFGVQSGKNKDFISNQTQLSFGVFHRFSKKTPSKPEI